MNPACPFCRIVRAEFGEPVETRPEDLVLRHEDYIAFVDSRGFGRRPGHLLVLPTAHVETLEAMTEDLASRIGAALPRLARIVREAYGAEGLTVRQNDGEAGDQDVWHVHFHLVPRWKGDGFNGGGRVRLDESVRRSQAESLREVLERA